MHGGEAELELAWERAVGRGPLAGDLLQQVLARYREPHRRYHGVSHLVWVVRHVRRLAATDEVVAESPDLGAVLAAAFFHDAVYDPARHDNEERSAALAELRLGELADAEQAGSGATAWPPARRELVTWLVEATAHTAPGDGDPGDGRAMEHAVLLDADLAILGAEPAAYQAYANGVRAEYAHVPDGAWRAGRAAVLERLLAPDHLYRTVAGRAWWEARARANLTAELASLG